MRTELLKLLSLIIFLSIVTTSCLNERSSSKEPEVAEEQEEVSGTKMEEAESGPLEFYHGTLAEAQQKAKEENKLLFVDAYATWCGPCKMLERYTFQEAEVGQFFNSNFVNFKLNGEQEVHREFMMTHEIRAYPTMLFIDGEGEVVERFAGYMDGKTLIRHGNKALRKHEKG